MTEHEPQIEKTNIPADELTIPQLALALKALGDTVIGGSDIIDESVKNLKKLQNLNKLLGRLAPGGSAPRTAIEQLWKQADTNHDETPMLLELRHMLSSHYGEWTPAIREAEGLPPAE